MTGRTHDLAAFTALNYIFISEPLIHTSLGTVFVTIGACLVGGLAPDIDQPTADLWNRLPGGSIVGRILTPLLGSHRMISHSVVGIVIAGIVTKYALNILHSVVLADMHIVWYGFMIGFISHIVMDIITKEGEPLLFPIPWKIGLPPLRFLRIETGGLIEKSIIFPSLMIANGYFIYANYHKFLEFLKLYIK